MTTYLLHAPHALAVEQAAEKAVLVKDRFIWSAFVFGPLWFFWNRLWIAGLAVAAAMVLLGGLFHLAGIHPAMGALGQLVLALLIGFEAPMLKSWTLNRNGAPAATLVCAASLEDAETKGFARWLGAPQAPAPSFHSSGPARSEPVIGLFPEAQA